MEHYSEDYFRIKNNIKNNWPAYKIESFNNNFAISPYVKKMKKKMKSK